MVKNDLVTKITTFQQIFIDKNATLIIQNGWRNVTHTSNRRICQKSNILRVWKSVTLPEAWKGVIHTPNHRLHQKYLDGTRESRDCFSIYLKRQKKNKDSWLRRCDSRNIVQSVLISQWAWRPVGGKSRQDHQLLEGSTIWWSRQDTTSHLWSS